ncbi:MAG: ribosome small subunit-dependent GTPase A [Bacteroidia bacterium]|nr:ribosome small subunit-dependent GTPase A [Bacteroidia bacterium]
MKGLVTKSTGSWYEVLGDNQLKYQCRTRGKLRLEGIKETNPIAVGDRIDFIEENGVGSIEKILPRENQILRQSIKKTGHSQVLAANVDQVLLIATLKQPRTSLGFIDRFLVSAESFRIPQVLFFNKSDLLTPQDILELDSIKKIYSSIGVDTLTGSAIHDDITIISKVLENKVTLVAGHSGVGKSTLLNRIAPEIKQTIGDISSFSDKGTHTTTFAEMFQLNSKTFVIDTPGVKEWGLVDMSQQEISDYFPEMRDVRLNCKFGARCIHINEPKCSVLEALNAGAISAGRYKSYVSMVMGEDNRK